MDSFSNEVLLSLGLALLGVATMVANGVARRNRITVTVPPTITTGGSTASGVSSVANASPVQAPAAPIPPVVPPAPAVIGPIVPPVVVTFVLGVQCFQRMIDELVRSLSAVALDFSPLQPVNHNRDRIRGNAKFVERNHGIWMVVPVGRPMACMATPWCSSRAIDNAHVG